VEFPWGCVDRRSLIYASLGTVVNRNDTLYRIIIDVCSAIDAQLVLSLGGAGNVDSYRDLPGSRSSWTWAKEFHSWQSQLLSISPVLPLRANIDETPTAVDNYRAGRQGETS
jgi:zeaxanthin glucosyltransferase